MNSGIANLYGFLDKDYDSHSSVFNSFRQNPSLSTMRQVVERHLGTTGVTLNNDQEDHVSNANLCVWGHRHIKSTSHYPQVLMEANLIDGSKCEALGILYNCIPVTHMVPVLKIREHDHERVHERVHEHQECEYEHQVKLFELQVGFTCTKTD